MAVTKPNMWHWLSKWAADGGLRSERSLLARAKGMAKKLWQRLAMS